MTRQKGYCLLKEESLFHVPFPLCFRVQCWGLHQFSSPCHLSRPPCPPPPPLSLAGCRHPWRATGSASPAPRRAGSLGERGPRCRGGRTRCGGAPQIYKRLKKQIPTKKKKLNLPNPLHTHTRRKLPQVVVPQHLALLFPFRDFVCLVKLILGAFFFYFFNKKTSWKTISTKSAARREKKTIPCVPELFVVSC